MLDKVDDKVLDKVTKPSVSVIIPCRNERRYIEPFVDSLRLQSLDGLDVEFLIADGMSDDGSREVLLEFAKRFPAVRLIDNPQSFVSSGLNRAINAARGEIIIRMDVHTEYAPDYIRKCVEVLQKTGAANVGGPAQTRSRNYLQAAIALAYHSAFSSGGASFHKIGYEGFVDTVTYGCWRKQTLLEIGLFDEELIRNQDDELNLRITRAGGKIWQSPAIESWYYPRASIAGLFRQYAQYGYWKVRVIQKHRLPASPRHLIPGAFVGALVLLALGSPFFASVRWVFIALLGTYLLVNLAASLHTCATGTKLKFLPVMPLIFAAYHFGYGYGFLRGLIDFGLLKKRSQSSFAQMTRGQRV